MGLSLRPVFGLRPQQWMNLAMIVLALFYLLYTTGMLLGRGLFETVGGDYRAFRASAEIAVSEGFAQVYDLQAQERYQRPLYESYARLDELYATAPFAYPPAFILLFVPLLCLSPAFGFVLWTALNLFLLAFYCQRFTRALSLPWGPRLLALVFLSYYVFLNTLFGQVNLLLLVGLGEFYLAVRRGQGFRGGLWLGLLLLKPQALVLLLPALLVGRRVRILAGSVVSGLAVLGLSLVVGGGEALIEMGEMILLWAEGLPTNVPQYMINWRAVQVNLGDMGLPAAGWGVAIVGMAATAALGLSFWFKPPSSSSSRFAVALLGTYAATCAVAWHAHVQMAMPLLLPLLFLVGQGELPRWMLNSWALLPAGVFFAALLPLPGSRAELTGFVILVLNLYLLGWSFWRYWAGDRELASRGGGRGGGHGV